jgi:regulator of replication initiation timing
MECPVCKNITEGAEFRQCSICDTDLEIFTIAEKLEKRANRRKKLLVFFFIVSIASLLAIPGLFLLMSEDHSERLQQLESQVLAQLIQIQTLTNENQMLMAANIDLRFQIENLNLQLADLSEKQQTETTKEPELREIIHIVGRGDNLKKLAARYYNDSEAYRRIMQDNNLRNPNHISIGQRLKITVPVTD